MIRRYLAIALMSGLGTAYAQDTVINVYPGLPPLSTGEIGEEFWDNGRVSNVQIPQLYIFKPKAGKENGAAIMYCPGGGYGRLAMAGYGKGYGEYFSELGYTVAVLKYRLPVSENIEQTHLVPFTDATRAMRLLKFMSDDLGFEKELLGIMGGSAGGHLASSISTRNDAGNKDAMDPVEKESSTPAFSVLIYPVITMDTTIAHMGSRRNLIGKSPSDDLVELNSNELQVSEDTPPTFIVHGTNDASVSVLNSIRYFEALRANDVLVEIHVFQDGPHGSGLGKPNTPWSSWKEQCAVWLDALLFD